MRIRHRHHSLLDSRLVGVAGDGPQPCPVRDDGLLHRLGEVVPQVPSVSDLHGVRGTGAGAVGVGAGPVPTHDSHARMPAQPGRDRLRGAVGQHIQRPVGVDVDDDRAVQAGSTSRVTAAESAIMMLARGRRT